MGGLNKIAIGSRIEQIRGSLSKPKFSIKYEIHKNTLIGYESGVREPSSEFVIKLMQYEGVNPIWLLTGQGSISVNQTNEERAVYKITSQTSHDSSVWLDAIIDANHANIPLCAKEAFRSLLVQSATSAKPEENPYASLVINAVAEIAQYQQEYVFIPAHEVGASTGYDTLMATEILTGQIAFRKDWIKEKDLHASNLAMITVRGDSMQPTIADGDIVLIDTRVQKIIDDSIYMVSVDGSSVVKRVQKNIDGTLSIISDNNRYDKQKLSKEQSEQLTISGRVVWYGHEI